MHTISSARRSATAGQKLQRSDVGAPVPASVGTSVVILAATCMLAPVEQRSVRLAPGRRNRTTAVWYAVGAALILILATWLRLQRLYLVEFKNDEAQALLHAEDLVELGK